MQSFNGGGGCLTLKKNISLLQSSRLQVQRIVEEQCKLLRHGENRAGGEGGAGGAGGVGGAGGGGSRRQGTGQVEAGCRPNAIQLYMDFQIQIYQVAWGR